MKAYQLIEYGKPLEGGKYHYDPFLCCIIHIFNIFIVREVKKPVPTGCQVLAKSILTGVCHTDVHVAAGDWGGIKLPITPGHEGIGVVETIGPDVKNLKIGDRIGVAWLGSSCMECDLCKKGRENMCENQQQTGYVRDGSFAEYFIADERFAAK